MAGKRAPKPPHETEALLHKYRTGPQDADARAQTLKALYRMYKRCPRLAQLASEANFVPGVGKFKPKIMFIGEAPGRNENVQLKPFVGSAGKVLDDGLSYVGLRRTKQFITNGVKFRPPANRDPSYREVDASLPYLRAEIEIVNPRMLVTLGRHSLEMLLGPLERVSETHGQLRQYEGRDLFPMYHPISAILSPALKEEFLRDFKTLMELLE